MPSGKQSKRDLALLGLGGVIAPIQFTVLMYIAGLLRPGYSHVTQQISELGEIGGSTAAIQNTGFFVAGLLIIAVSWGFHKGVTGGEGSRTGPLFLTLAGIGLIGVSVFRCDPGCPFGGSLSNQIHLSMFLLAVITASIALVFFSTRLKRDQLWRRYRVYSIASGILTLGILIAWFTTPFGEILMTGGTERLITVIPLLWLEIMSIRLISISAK